EQLERQGPSRVVPTNRRLRPGVVRGDRWRWVVVEYVEQLPQVERAEANVAVWIVHRAVERTLTQLVCDPVSGWRDDLHQASGCCRGLDAAVKAALLSHHGVYQRRRNLPLAALFGYGPCVGRRVDTAPEPFLSIARAAEEPA